MGDAFTREIREDIFPLKELPALSISADLSGSPLITASITSNSTPTKTGLKPSERRVSGDTSCRESGPAHVTKPPIRGVKLNPGVTPPSVAE
jgi:hypothetical protein